MVQVRFFCHFSFSRSRFSSPDPTSRFSTIYFPKMIACDQAPQWGKGEKRATGKIMYSAVDPPTCA